MTSVQKLHHSISLVLAFTTIQELLCYCGINDLPNGAQFKNNPRGRTHGEHSTLMAKVNREPMEKLI